jgi:hypothetical protein
MTKTGAEKQVTRITAGRQNLSAAHFGNKRCTRCSGQILWHFFSGLISYKNYIYMAGKSHGGQQGNQSGQQGSTKGRQGGQASVRKGPGAAGSKQQASSQKDQQQNSQSTQNKRSGR